MANHLNWGAAFGGAATGLGQAVNVSAAKDIEEMRATRAENLARFSLTKQQEHEDWRAKLSSDTQKAIAERAETVQGMRDTAAEKRSQEANAAYMDRMTAAAEAAEGRQRTELSARQKIEDSRLQAQNRLAMQQATEQIDGQIRMLHNQIAGAMKGNYAISMISDPDKRREAMAKDPTIAPMLEQLVDLDKSRVQTIRSFTLYAASLGDPTFSGKQTSQLPGGGTRPASNDDTQATSTPNNPNDKSVPQGYPTNNPADSAPAVEPTAFHPGGGMPPTLGPQRPPVRSMAGPLVSPQGTIPSLMPGVGGGPPDQSAGGLSPFQQPPSGAIPSLMPGT